MNRNEALAFIAAVLAVAAIGVSYNINHQDSPEQARVEAFRSCMNTMGTTEAGCKEVIREAESNSR